MPSYVEWVRQFCLTLPGTTEKVQWEHDLLFLISGKMYCIVNLEPGIGASRVAFKSTPQKFAELVEIEGVIPAPYLARNHWVALVEVTALPQKELKTLIRNSYELVMAKLPKKTQAALTAKKK